jgi:hypothetical protein
LNVKLWPFVEEISSFQCKNGYTKSQIQWLLGKKTLYLAKLLIVTIEISKK